MKRAPHRPTAIALLNLLIIAPLPASVGTDPDERPAPPRSVGRQRL